MNITPEFWTRPPMPGPTSYEVVFNRTTHNIEKFDGKAWVALSHDEIDGLGPPYPDIPTR